MATRNVRVRGTLAREEYPFLSQSDRKPRLLEDLWVQLSGLTPYLVDILATILQLKKMKGRQRVKIAAYLQSEFQQFYRDFTSFTNSSAVMEVVPIIIFSRHTYIQTSRLLPATTLSAAFLSVSSSRHLSSRNSMSQNLDVVLSLSVIACRIRLRIGSEDFRESGCNVLFFRVM